MTYSGQELNLLLKTVLNIYLFIIIINSNLSMHKVLIVIGLPGSGKSTLAKKLEGYIIFDDFITTFFNGAVISELKTQNKICLIDPRLCIPDIFNRYMDAILNYVQKEDIHLILFENDKDNCLNNIKLRDDKRKGIQNQIYKYSEIYSTDFYNGWDFEVLKVWSSNSTS